MLLTNHTLTGIVLGLTIDNPAILAPVAVASHLAQDSVPHFDFGTPHKNWPHERNFLILGSCDFALSIVVTVGAVMIWPARAGHIVIGVVGAALPDLTYIPLIVFGKDRVHRLVPGYKRMNKFLSWIQWSQTPWGIVTEIIWATGMVALLIIMM